LSWKLRAFQCQARFIELADSVNSGMPAYVVERTSEALNDQGKPLRGSKILLYGVAYKRDVSDSRESPAFGIAHGLLKRGALVSYMDPFVRVFEDGGDIALTSLDASTHFGGFDAVVIVTDHSDLPRERVLREANLVVDTRDTLREVAGDRSKVYGL
jgi:UDP-N-acetyl-D-glucosamine dehydrogenase